MTRIDAGAQLKGIDDLIQIYSDEILFDKQEFDLLRKEHLAVFSNWRHYILAAASFAATFFVSMAEIEPVKSHLVQLLSITIPIGLGSFFLLNAFRNMASIMLDRIDEMYLQMISILYYMRAYVAGLSLQFDNVDQEKQQTLARFVAILYSNRVTLWHAYRQTSKSILLSQRKKILDQKAAQQKEMTKDALKEFIEILEEHRRVMPDRLRELSESLEFLSSKLQDLEKAKLKGNLEQKQIDFSAEARGHAHHYQELEFLNELISDDLEYERKRISQASEERVSN
jgi:hypothetical protein